MNTLKLPASCTLMTEEELRSIHGGTTLETAAKAVLAVGVSAGLVIVAGAAAAGILSIFRPSFWPDLIDRSQTAGKNLIEDSVETGKTFLDAAAPNL